MPKRRHRNRRSHKNGSPPNADQRHLQGLDEKQFKINDVVTISNGGTGIAAF
jgi:hypothetical protein